MFMLRSEAKAVPLKSACNPNMFPSIKIFSSVLIGQHAPNIDVLQKIVIKLFSKWTDDIFHPWSESVRKMGEINLLKKRLANFIRKGHYHPRGTGH